MRGDKIAAIGSTEVVRALAGPATRVIDLGGRTVIPGLIDSHIHAIRAGLTYMTEVHWFGVRTLAEALEKLRAADKAAPPGAWLVVAGGWTDRQFKEDRRPTQAEIVAAAPNHHVYIQQLYSRVLLDRDGADALAIPAELAARLAVERDPAGQPTGWLTGDNRAISDLFNLLPRPDVRAEGRGHAGVLSRAQCARPHRRQRSRRLQPLHPRLSAAVPGLARGRAYAAGALQPVRAAPRP